MLWVLTVFYIIGSPLHLVILGFLGVFKSKGLKRWSLGLWHGLNWLTDRLQFKTTSLLFLALSYYRIYRSLFWCDSVSVVGGGNLAYRRYKINCWSSGGCEGKEKKNKVFTIKNANWQFLKQHLMTVLHWTCSSGIQSAGTIYSENFWSPEWMSTARVWLTVPYRLSTSYFPT